MESCMRFTHLLVLFVFLWGGGVVSSVHAGKAEQMTPYHLSAGDVLELSVWGDEDLQREVLIRPDGKISFPLIGDVQAAGKSVNNLKTELEKKINKYVPDVPVTVILKTINYPKVFIVGKVQNPSLYIMEGNTTVVQALAMAGGLTTFASKNDISVLRQTKSGQEIFPFKYGDIEKGKSLEQNIVLSSGDTIIVP